MDLCYQIASMLREGTAVETVFNQMVCDWDMNAICEATSERLGRPCTILDGLLLHLEAYHEHDDIDDMFFDLAELVLIMIMNGAQHEQTVEHVFKCLSIDSMRARYIAHLRRTNPAQLTACMPDLVRMMLVDRNYSDEYNPTTLARLLIASGLDRDSLLQVLQEWNTPLMQQSAETYPIYKRLSTLIRAVRASG